jgi:hypothetical protein
MAQSKLYRCWFKDGSMRLIHQKDHHDAALEAQELAGLANGDMPKDVAERKRWLAACKVVRTECLTDGTEAKWKA